MVQALLEAFNLVKKPVKKEQLLKTFNTIQSLIQEDLLPSLQELKNFEKSSKITKSELYNVTKELTKIKGSKVKSVITDLEGLFSNINKNLGNIEKLISKHASSIYTNKVLGVKDAAIIKLVDDLGSLTMYTMDYVTCLLSDPKNTEFPKIKFKKVKEGIPAFVDLINGYHKKLDDILENITKLDDTAINKEMSTGLMDMKFKNSGVNILLPQGFINNPFYHIRMWFVDRDIAKLEALKDKKRLIELRIMELKVEEKSGSDGDLSKQIAYYEDKLATIEYNIQKLEEV